MEIKAIEITPEHKKPFVFFALLGSTRDQIHVKGFDSFEEYHSYSDGFRDALGWLEAAITDDLSQFYEILDDYVSDSNLHIVKEFKENHPIEEEEEGIDTIDVENTTPLEEMKLNKYFLENTQCQKDLADFVTFAGTARNIPMRISVPVSCLDIVSRDNKTSFPISHEVLSEINNFDLEGFHNE